MGASIVAVILYIVYLRTDYFDQLGELVDGLAQDDWQTSANKLSNRAASVPLGIKK